MKRRASAWRSRLIAFAVSALAIVLASGVAPSRALTLNPVYAPYNKQLIFLYADDIISWETLRRKWLGSKPSQAEVDESIELLEIVVALKGATSRHVQAKLASAAATTGSYALSSSTPALPFAGNRLVVLGAVPFNSNTDLSAITLRRQGDCSLVEDVFEPVNNLLTASSVVELTGAQDYFHTLSGLTTTADVFPNGCPTDATLGVQATFTTQLVGVTANGLDVVASLTGNGTIQVQEVNQSTGAASTVTLGAGSNIRSFAVADVNGDGANDIVASGVTDPNTGKPAFGIYISNRDGTFKTPSYVDATPTISFTLDDVNGDGKPDIVYDNPQFDSNGIETADRIATALGNGDGTFRAGGTTPVSITGHGFLFITGDFNGDGKKDLLFGGLVLLGAGDGTFSAGPPLPGTSVSGPQYEVGIASSAAVGDFDKDGKLDIAYSMANGGASIVQILHGNGDGSFSARSRYASLTPEQQLTVTDVDGDGNLDIVVGNGSQGVYVQGSGNPLGSMFQLLMGRGDGTFVGAPVYGDRSSPVVTADFNGDGKPDAMVVGRTPSGAPLLEVLPGDGAGGLGTAISSTFNVYVTAAAAADMNKDGKPDAVLAGIGTSGGGVRTGPKLAVLTNQGSGAFAPEVDYTLSDNPVSIVTGDFNGDGVMDVAVGVAPGPGNTGDSGVYVLLGQSNGSLGSPVKIDSSLNPVSLAAADLNGDGRTDLVVAGKGFFNYIGAPQQVNGALHVYLGKADGSFTTATAPTTSATNYSVVGLGDLNGDGKLDLIVGGNVAGSGPGTGTPNLYTLLGNGDGTFQAGVAFALAGSDGLGAQSLALADFNHDGKLDVAVGNPNDFTELFIGIGDGTLAHSLLALGQQPSGLAAADLNGDGMPDLLIAGASGMAVLLNSSAGSWPAIGASAGGASTTTTLAAAPSPAAVGQSVTLTTTVASTTAGTPTGTVTFLDGTTSLGSGAVSAQGTATFSTSSLTAGVHSLTAQYSGDSTYASSVSAAVSLTVNAGTPDFSVSAGPTSGSAAAGQAATTTITVTPSNGFTGTVTLACTGLPTGATCAFSPSSVSVRSGAVTSALTISSTARTAMKSAPPLVDPWAPGGVVLSSVGLPLVAKRRGRWAKRSGGRLGRTGRVRYQQESRGTRRLGFGQIALALLIVGVGILYGCGGGGGNSGGGTGGGSSGTPAGSYTVTVTATSGSTSHTTTYALTIS